MQRLVQPADNPQARLRLRLATARHRYNLGIVVLVAEEERQAELDCRKRRGWVRPWLMRRPVHGEYDSLMMELCREF